MKRPKVIFASNILRTILLLVGFTLLMWGLSMLITNGYSSYLSSLRSTQWSLYLNRRYINNFREQNGRFPKSLNELHEDVKGFPKYIKWKFPPVEAISSPSDRSEHAVLDGKGGLYYNPETGELKVNLTKPLKTYWRFYFGKKRDEVPSSW